MKYNLSKIMTEANRMRGKYKLTKSESLKAAWAGAKTGTTYQDWKQCKIDTGIACDNTWKNRYDYTIIVDSVTPNLSIDEYLRTRKNEQVSYNNISIDNLNFENM